ncbi:MAG TPA: hypothetical protein P5078_00435 [Candidatus Marinimicrobia bacterium]|nr:hypothetical protein [Candidatus Neomarinimicrobiota bacterium]
MRRNRNQEGNNFYYFGQYIFHRRPSEVILDQESQPIGRELNPEIR